MDFYCVFLTWLPLLVLLLPFLSLQFLRKKKGTDLPPGPPKLPIIGNLHQLGKKPHRSLFKLSQKYGPLMYLKLGQVPTLVISSGDVAKDVFKTFDVESCSRPLTEGARRLSYNFLDVAFSPYGAYWREMRKIFVAELLSAKKVRSFAFVREEEVAKFLDSISRAFPNAVNLSERLFYCLDAIICRIVCGRTYEGKQFEKFKLEDAINEAMAILGSLSAEDFFPFAIGRMVDVLTGLNARREKCFRDFDGFYQRMLDEHLDPARPKPGNEDLIDVLLGLSNDRLGAGGITQDHMKGILMVRFQMLPS